MSTLPLLPASSPLGFSFDPQANALYVRFNGAESVETVTPEDDYSPLVDVDASGGVIGVEVLCANRSFADPSAVTEDQFRAFYGKL
jgi:uncharacterized protein YuzE